MAEFLCFEHFAANQLKVHSPVFFQIEFISNKQWKRFMNVTFDTDRLVENLKSSGIPHEQARAIVRGIVEAQTELVTKRDIDDLRKDILAMEQRIVIKMGGLIALAIGVVAVLVKLLLRGNA